MIGQEVRRRRGELGLTGAELAARSGLSPGAISQIENGKRTPSSTTVMKLARGLGVEVGELYPKDLSQRLPLEERGERPPEAIEQALARVLELVRTEALRERQAFNRTLASEGERQSRIGDIAEAEAGTRFVDEFSPDEIPAAFGEVALGYARFEQENTDLQQALIRGQKLLRERDQKIARLEEENAQLREQHGQVKAEKT
jgi:transcriptional regulator with XRE-family HTH domain